MANKKFWLGIPVIVLVFGFMVVGCDNGSTDRDGGADISLNGTWVGEGSTELKLNNGNFEVSSGRKGTYTTSGSNGTITVTHIHGDMMGGMLESKWYTKNELRAALVPSTMDEGTFNEYFGSTFSSRTGTYSVSANKLTMTVEGKTTIYTKK
jgi:hypothetical protein